MKPVIIILAILFFLLQYKLWFQTGGISEIFHLKQSITAQNEENKELTQHNDMLAAEVEDLKSGQSAIEEHARNDLGMVKPNETFYQVVDK